MTWAASIERRFSLLLLASFGLGLLVPGLDAFPTVLVPILLGCVLFLACAKIRPDDLASLAPGRVALFFVLRFLAVPAVLVGLAWAIRPELALPALVFGLLPAGVTTTAITSILGGNPALSLGVTALSTCLAPLLIPVAVSVLGVEASLDPVAMGRSLVMLLFFPTAAWFGVGRRLPRLRQAVDTWGGVSSVGLICVIALLVAGSQRMAILEDPFALAGSFGVGLVLYAALYVLGLAFGRGQVKRDRVAWALCAGNNNIVLGVTLALLYFQPADVVVLLAWDLAWITSLSLVQPVLRRLT